MNLQFICVDLYSIVVKIFGKSKSACNLVVDDYQNIIVTRDTFDAWLYFLMV